MASPRNNITEVKKEEPVVPSGSKQEDLRKDFTCAICSLKFEVHNDLLKHFLQHGNNEIDFRGRPKGASVVPRNVHPAAKTTIIQCEWCPEQFPDISKAIQHKHRKHPNIMTSYYCEYCGKLFPFRISLIQHQFNCKELPSQMTSNPNPLFKCIFCDAKFITVNAKTTHEKNTHFATIPTTIVPPPSKKIKLINSGEWCSLYYCHLCGSEYAMKHNLRKHLENTHSESERTEFPINGLIKCKACDAIFHTKHAYNVHNLHHTKDDIIVHSEEERLRRVQKVDQDLDFHRIQIPTTIKLTSKGKIPQKYRQFMQSVKVNLTQLPPKVSPHSVNE